MIFWVDTQIKIWVFLHQFKLVTLCVSRVKNVENKKKF
jgi:hypothetical protein